MLWYCRAVRLAACPRGEAAGHGLHSAEVREAASRTIAMFPLCPLQVPLNCWLRKLRKTVCYQCVDLAFPELVVTAGRRATLGIRESSYDARNPCKA
jgi:hypothetical protein